MRLTKVRQHDKEEPGRLRVAAHNLGEPLAVRPRVLHELFLLVSLDPLERFAGRVDLSGQL